MALPGGLPPPRRPAAADGRSGGLGLPGPMVVFDVNRIWKRMALTFFVVTKLKPSVQHEHSLISCILQYLVFGSWDRGCEWLGYNDINHVYHQYDLENAKMIWAIIHMFEAVAVRQQYYADSG